MKKKLWLATLGTFAVVSSVMFVVACKKNYPVSSSNAASTATTAPSQTAKRGISGLQQYAISKTDANGLISAYVQDQNLVGTKSFMYPADILLDYLTTVGSIDKLHCLLGEKYVNNQPVLTLVFAAVDANGDHIYMTEGNPAVSYVLDFAFPCPVCDKITLENPVAASTYVSANYPQNLLLSTAQTEIATYQNRQTKNTTASSFLVDAANLTNYLTNATDVKSIQLFLAEDGNGDLTLIIIGIDTNGNEVYISNNNNAYAFDNAYPCPTCATLYNNGVNLE